MAKGKSARFGIGLGNSEIHNRKIMKASLDFLKDGTSSVFIFGSHKSLETARKQILLDKIPNIQLVEFQESEEEIFKYLNDNEIDVIIRGSLSSSSFLTNLKKFLNTNRINRLALLETVDRHPFFYGPVGIDECKDTLGKVEFLEKAIEIFELLGITPKISILSGGRKGDLGRDAEIDESIRSGDETVSIMRKRYPKLQINHDEILIENAAKNKSNLIIAPDGISGNLIYRTLVHLGGGKAYGAIYMGLKKIIIDTSRVGDSTEIKGAFLLALALSK
ncbi:MAG: methanogenesis marker protein Mmp4/MtxX [Promethearchaeota archaeon]|jgi:putative methanogen marker protein 4